VTPGTIGTTVGLAEDRIREEITRYLEDHPGGPERLVSLLHTVQGKLGYLPVPVLEWMADPLGLSPVQVHGVVSFYSFFTTEPGGRFRIRLCRGTTCYLRPGLPLLDLVRELLGIDVGETTADGIFRLEQVRCIGACGQAPALTVNGEIHGHLTPAGLRALVDRLRREAGGGAEPQGGPRA
jgi:NADH:ubiquinone oxidoreductase subunit E